MLTFSRLAAACVASALLFSLGGTAIAQCSTCPQPTIAYSPVAAPVVQTAYAPVYQSTTVAPRWYPGMYLRRLLGVEDTVVATTYAATAYQPTYPANYSVGYAPAAYTAGYAPATYTAGYATTAYTAGYAPTAYTAGYRAVTLSPVVDACCPTDCTGCSSCAGGAVTAGYYEPSGGCSNCAGGASQTIYEESPSSSQPYYGSEQTPNPALPPDADVPVERQKPVTDEQADESDESSVLEGEESSYFQAPQLFSPQGKQEGLDRVTRRPTAPVWTAVYKQDARVSPASATTNRPAPKHRSLDASGWSSAAN